MGWPLQRVRDPRRANWDGIVAHADADEILRCLGNFKKSPRTVFITHREPAASEALWLRIRKRFGWHCVVPDHGQKVELS